MKTDEGNILLCNNKLSNVASQSMFINASSMAKKVEEFFESDDQLVGVTIIDDDDGQLLGMISRKRFMETYSKPFRKDLYNRRPLKLFVKDDFDSPLCMDETADIDYAVQVALSRSKDLMYEPVVVRSLQGGLKLIDTQVLLLELAKAHEQQSKELQKTLAQVQQLNTKLQETQDSIQESLNCASVIQKSILPRKELFDQQFSESLIINCPRDIVGGDLYWLREINGLSLLAVIDCTGHGVPGAFMTMTVNSVLNQVVDTICTDDPASILGEVNKILQKTLLFRRDDSSMVDAGLDIALCCIDPKQHKLTFAGAGLSLYMLVDGELFEIKGDRAGIGYSGSNPDFKYTNHIRYIGIGTTLYAYTDGFLDENGGIKGFGFGRDRFEKMLLQHSHHTLELQKEFFEKTLADWQGSRSQRDDITLVGIRL